MIFSNFLGLDSISYIVVQLAVVLIWGFFGGFVAKKLKLPQVTGYLFFGIFLGGSLGLFIPKYNGFLTENDLNNFNVFGEIALSFIAFSIGSEFKLAVIKKNGKKIALISLLEVIIPVVFVFVIILLVPKPTNITKEYKIFSTNNLVFSLALSSIAATTATATIVLVVRQYRSYGSLTSTVLPVTALDDVFGIVIFGVTISIIKSVIKTDPNINIGVQIAKPFLEIILSVGLGFGLGYLISFITKKLHHDFDDLQIFTVSSVIGVIALTIVFNHFLKDYVELSSLLINIVIGAIITNTQVKSEKTFEAINNFSSPFYLLFFTLAGASLNIQNIKGSYELILLTLAYILLRGAGKYTGAFLGTKAMQSEKKVQKNIGLCLFPQSGLAIGLLVIINQAFSNYNSDFPKAFGTIIMLSSLVFEILGPVFIKLALKRTGELYGLDKLYSFDNIETRKEKQL